MLKVESWNQGSGLVSIVTTFGVGPQPECTVRVKRHEFNDVKRNYINATSFSICKEVFRRVLPYILCFLKKLFKLNFILDLEK